MKNYLLACATSTEIRRLCQQHSADYVRITVQEVGTDLPYGGKARNKLKSDNDDRLYFFISYFVLLFARRRPKCWRQEMSSQGSEESGWAVHIK